MSHLDISHVDSFYYRVGTLFCKTKPMKPGSHSSVLAKRDFKVKQAT